MSKKKVVNIKRLDVCDMHCLFDSICTKCESVVRYHHKINGHNIRIYKPKNP
jgi:hypothetical protein